MLKAGCCDNLVNITSMSKAGAQLMTWFGMACELHRDWRNDIEGLGALFSNHIPDYRNLINSYNQNTSQK